MMNWRSIFLYNILPKKRLVIAFIGFLISSIIITGGAILMDSIVDATSSYLGESDYILVISNPFASTPYTSILPLELAETIKSVPGVIDVSPEVMTAAVYKDKAVYFRGVDVEKFWDFTEVTYLEGLPLDSNDTFEVSVGDNFAKRNNLETGDLFTLFSTRSNAAIELKVKSIFFTGTLLDDEIIAPLWIGQFFAFETFNYITHVRVRIDESVSKESVRTLVTSEYELTVNLVTPDSLEILNATVYFRSGKGNLIKEEIILNGNSVSVVLPFGEYELQAEIEGVISEPSRLILGENSSIPIYVEYIERELNIRIITDENEPLEGAEITIYSQLREERILGKKTYYGFSDSNGEARFTVSNGSYYAEVEYDVYWKTKAFTTGDVNNINITLIDRHPTIIVRSPKNYSLVIGQELNVSIGVTQGYSVLFYHDDNPGNTQEYQVVGEGQVPPPGILLSLDEGSHSLTVIAYNKDYPGSGDKSRNYKEVKVYFTISHDFPEQISFINVLNGSQIFPSSTLYLNSTLYFSHNTTYKWDNDNWDLLTGTSIKTPSTIGIHKLQIKASTSNDSKVWTFYFIVTDNPQKIGVTGFQYTNHLTSASTIQAWYDLAASNVLYHWDSNVDVSIPLNNLIPTASLNEGNHTLNLSAFVSSQWYYKSYNVIIDDSQPNITLEFSNSSSIESGEVFTYFSNETLSWLKFSWDDLSFSTAYNSSIPIPQENGFHSLRITANDLAGNVINLYYEFQVENFSVGVPIDFYMLYEYNGVINQSFIDLSVFSESSFSSIDFSLEGPVEKSGNLTGMKRVYLYSGAYTLTITYNINIFQGRTRIWTFTIGDSMNSSFLDTASLNESYFGEITVYFPNFDFNITLISQSSLFLTDGSYYFYSNLVDFPNNRVEHSLLVDTILPTISVLSPNKGEENMILPLTLGSDAVEIYFKWGQETRLYEEGFYLDHTSIGKHTIIFTLIDSFYNEKIVVYSYYVGLEYVTMNLTFQASSGIFIIPLANLSVSISSIYNSTFWSSNSTEEGYLIFNIFPGKFYASFEYANMKHNLLLNTNEGLNQTIFIGNSDSILEIKDYFVGVPIQDQYCLIRDSYGRRITTLKTNNIGRIYTSLSFGDYICYFKRTDEVISVPFQIYSPNQLVTIKIPSPKHRVVFDFRYDNGSNIYNLPITFTTLIDGDILTSTGLYSSASLWISYGIVNITVTMKSGEQISLRRTFEPGKERITIILPSETEDQWMKIPFKPIAGFTFIVSLSLEYMDYYLRGSLLFTYTLAYAEVLLILLVVIVNMYSILQNVYKESRRETTIMRMIGSTKLNVIVTVFSRLGVIAAIASLIGYGLGTAILIILARVNQTVFFGHTFSPSGGWGIFSLNLVLILFTALISSIFIARKAAKEKKITYTKR